MTDPALPPLALALAAAVRCRLRLERSEAALAVAFVPAVVRLDAADRAYRTTIERTLRPEAARALLASMAAFRANVHDVRTAARREIDELCRRNGVAQDGTDPLDPHAPGPPGLSHVDSIRLASIGDAARARVDAQRARINASVTTKLDPKDVATLLEAKRVRRSAFEAALGGSLSALAVHGAVGDATALADAGHQLTLLADGWY